MIVVAIITILVSILLPGLRKARMSAKVAVCLSNESQIGRANIMHCKDNNGDFPLSSMVYEKGTHVYRRNNVFYNVGALHTYFENGNEFKGEVFYCPTRSKSPMYDIYNILPLKGGSMYWGNSAGEWRGDYMTRCNIDFRKGSVPNMYKTEPGITVNADFWYKTGAPGYPLGFGEFFHGGIENGVSALFMDGSAAIRRPGAAPFVDVSNRNNIEQVYRDFFDRK